MTSQQGLICLAVLSGNTRPPFAAITDCSVVSDHAYAFGRTDCSLYLLLQTDAGPATVRVDFADTTASRDFTAQAVEISPADTPGLAPDHVADVQQAVSTRGGLHQHSWTVVYGDG